MLKHFRRHRDDLFTFLDDPVVPFGSNAGERAIRPAVRSVCGVVWAAWGRHGTRRRSFVSRIKTKAIRRRPTAPTCPIAGLPDARKRGKRSTPHRARTCNLRFRSYRIKYLNPYGLSSSSFQIFQDFHRFPGVKYGFGTENGDANLLAIVFARA